MKRPLRLLAAVGAALTVAIPVVYAAGLWMGLPVVGSSAYCSGASVAGVPGTTGTCNTTVPAGPGALTGNEFVPMDLNAATNTTTAAANATPGIPGTNITSPQTAYVPVVSAASGAYLLTQPTGLVNMTLVVPNGISNVIQVLTGTETTYALVFPPNPFDGQLLRFAATNTVTTLFLTNAGAVSGYGGNVNVKIATTTLPTGLSPLGNYAGFATSGTLGFSYIYNAAGLTWYRIQ